MNENKWIIMLKGFLVGGTMIVPGVSGGTMAMILGIYDQLISAIASFRKGVGENVKILLLFAVGAGAGIFLLSAPLSELLFRYKMPVIYFFMGAVFGGVPTIQKKSEVHQISIDVILYMVIGLISVLVISAIPGNMILMKGNMVSLVLVGGIAAIALILPGISISHFFLILGMYEKLINAIRTVEVTFLLPLGLGVLLGTILFSKMLETAMRRKPKQTYLIILGFILGSVAGIFPGIPAGFQSVACMILAIIGYVSVYAISRISGKRL